jgi:hypothetical protein
MGSECRQRHCQRRSSSFTPAGVAAHTRRQKRLSSIANSTVAGVGTSPNADDDGGGDHDDGVTENGENVLGRSGRRGFFWLKTGVVMVLLLLCGYRWWWWWW